MCIFSDKCGAQDLTLLTFGIPCGGFTQVTNMFIFSQSEETVKAEFVGENLKARAMAGYENPTSTSIKASLASAVFKVRCDSTRPGEAVFVVGSHDALGSWSSAMALPLSTSADTFPWWQSAPVPLLAGMMIEYKYIKQREDRQGNPQWQKFDGNYRVTPVPGQVLQAVSEWEVASAEITTLSELLEEPEKNEKTSEVDKVAAKQEKEDSSSSHPVRIRRL